MDIQRPSLTRPFWGIIQSIGRSDSQLGAPRSRPLLTSVWELAVILCRLCGSPQLRCICMPSYTVSNASFMRCSVCAMVHGDLIASFDWTHLGVRITAWKRVSCGMWTGRGYDNGQQERESNRPESWGRMVVPINNHPSPHRPSSIHLTCCLSLIHIPPFTLLYL